MSDMKTELCAKCSNTVVGEFTPSKTREWLTDLAKKGGMKAVLAAAGSVIPGFGNAAGFITGFAIDKIYGNDINKFVDYVADQFDDNKIYVFTCPKCGHTWSRKEDDIQDCDTECSGESTSYSESEPDDSDDEFKVDFSDFIDKVDDASQDLKLMNKLCKDMGFKGGHYRNENNVIASQYYFLAGLCALLYAKANYEIDNPHTVKKQLEQAWSFLRDANALFPDKEYELMLASVDTLLAEDPEECANLDTIATEYYSFDNNTFFEEDYLIDIYEKCRFLSILHAGDVLLNDEHYEDDDELRINLWKSGVKLQNRDYKMVCNWQIADDLYDDRTSTGKLTTRCAKHLNEAFSAEGYNAGSCNVDKYFDREWLCAYTYYAISIIEGINPYAASNIDQGLKMLEEVAKCNDCYAKRVACHTLGEYLEKGEFVQKNISKALHYYTIGGCEKDVARLMSSSKTNDTKSFVAEPSHSSAEEEYVEELRACFEDGDISKSERRLLEKLRIKLGISEARAAELEARYTKPQLTDEEQEYINEYHECLADGGSISAGERRLLNKLRVKLGIDESRAAELEKI